MFSLKHSVSEKIYAKPKSGRTSFKTRKGLVQGRVLICMYYVPRLKDDPIIYFVRNKIYIKIISILNITQMSYLQSVPIDMYKKILQDLDIVDLLEICKTNKYTLDFCENDSFWKEYLIHNYDPKEFKKWDSDAFDKYVKRNHLAGEILNWKDLAMHKTGLKQWILLDLETNEGVFSSMIPVSFDDTVKFLIVKIFEKMSTEMGEDSSLLPPLHDIVVKLTSKLNNYDCVIFVSELGIIIAKAPLPLGDYRYYFYDNGFDDNNFLTTIDRNLPIGKWVINGLKIFDNLTSMRIETA
jgi:hypothetical protein